MSLRGKMNNVINFEFSEQEEDELVIVDVTLNEPVLLSCESLSVYVLVAAAGVESVNVKDEVKGEFLEMVVNEIASNKSTASCNQDPLLNGWDNLEFLALSQLCDALDSL
jgi:hypothetical protein